MKTGLFVVFEGGDGVGKTTQLERLAEAMRSAGREVVVTREPGGTQLGLHLRQLIMHGDHVAPRAEALLYAADRAHHVESVVKPALARGAVVLQDRFIDSSIVYQGGARGLGNEVERISRWATDGLLPDLTVVLDMAPDTSRMDRHLDRVERETVEHAEQIRQGFLFLAQRDPRRYAVIDAARPVGEVFHDVFAAARAALRRKREIISGARTPIPPSPVTP
ncbi:dTMP kinase [Demequina capsici]|uniref:Thymidylate kinase n=1 Tax=Demequina capsici TaxID=3075620 RepID=A0AA96JB77_9MICO|nr:dTMP kinase [Demequina sp. PMTSA13]WNM27763.1 dTMP kinase [Demequina sp. PMTSA13]